MVINDNVNDAGSKDWHGSHVVTKEDVFWGSCGLVGGEDGSISCKGVRNRAGVVAQSEGVWLWGLMFLCWCVLFVVGMF